MNPLMVELFMSIFGILCAFQIIPQCVRIYRRKSSDDLSIWTIGIAIAQQVLWFIYAIWKPVACLIVTEGIWFIFLTVLLCFVLKYRVKGD